MFSLKTLGKNTRMNKKFFVVLVVMVYFNDSGKGSSPLEGGALVEELHVPQFLCFAFPCIILWFV